VTDVSFQIRFLPENRRLLAEHPLDVFLAASRCDIWVEQPCGARTTCGRCRVRVMTGDAPVTDADRRLIAPSDLEAGWRLACQMTLAASCDLEVPPSSRAVLPKSFGDAGPLPGLRSAAPTGACGVAIDIGSTTLAAALVDLRDGSIKATTSRLNPQVRFGPDVISRIHFASEHDAGTRALHDVLVHGLGEMIRELLDASGTRPEDVVRVTAAGNATMTHTAAGVDTTALGQAPFLGHFTREWRGLGAQFGWPVHPRARVRLMPMVGHHVGGDTVAGILACDIDRAEGWHLLVDLGTNAEVVIGRRGHVAATSTAAGPAFEGANVSCGMRAAPGAIDAVRVYADGRMAVGTIANQAAQGLCGSGLVDAVAELLRAGVIAPSGYLRRPDECDALGVPPPLIERLGRHESGERTVALAEGVTLSAGDIRQLQLVKGSISAGITLMLDHLGLAMDDLEAVHVAGMFGAFLRKASMLALGLVPDIDPERVRFVGNAAGAGARLALADPHARRRAIRIGREAEYIELAGHPAYEDAFCAAIPFPEPKDARR
jgi:uncharacterized 2Fe-2S/4Fe-4S cluster protein (DUF4445 family)